MNAPQQPQYVSETSESVPQQPQYGSGSSVNLPQEPQYGSGSSASQPRQPQYGSGSSPSQPQQPQYGSGSSASQPQQPQYGSGSSVNAPQQPQYGSSSSANAPQQPKYGSGSASTAPQQPQYGVGSLGYQPQQNKRPQQQSYQSGTRRKTAPALSEEQGGVQATTSQQGGSPGGNYINKGQTSSQYGGTYPNNKKPSNTAKKPTFNYKPKFNSGQAATAGNGQASTPSVRGENKPYGSKNIRPVSSAKRPTTRFQYQSTTPSPYGRDTYRLSITTPRYQARQPVDNKTKRPYNDLDKGRRPTTRFIPRPTPPTLGAGTGDNKKRVRPNEVQIDEPTYGINSNIAKDVKDITIVDDTEKYAAPAVNPTKSNGRDVETMSSFPGSSPINPYESDTIDLGELQPSFTVTANFPVVSKSIANPRFTLAKSKNKYDYQGWLTDGDPLKDLPPLRPTTTLDITVVQTEAPKTVTYQNEWQTPVVLPSLSFVPQNPPPPPSNFESEWTAYQKGVNTQANLLKPTKTLQISVAQTDAPKTVTYANEWFARKENIKPSQTKVYTNYQYVSETRRPGLGNARIDIVDPYDDVTVTNLETSDQSGSPDGSLPSVVGQSYQNTSPRPIIRIDKDKSDNDDVSFVTPGSYQRRRRPTRGPVRGTPTPPSSYSPTSKSPIHRPAPPNYIRPDTSASPGEDSAFSGTSNPSYTSPEVNPTYPSLQDSTEPVRIKLEYKSPVRPGYQSKFDINSGINNEYDDKTTSVGSGYEGSVYPAVPTNPAYSDQTSSTRTRKPLLDPSGPGSNKVTYFGTNTTPEIINGNVRSPPRPPTVGLAGEVENQFPDSYQTGYQRNTNRGRGDTTTTPSTNYVTGYDNSGDNGVNSITVTSDGYKGYKNVDSNPTSPATYQNNYAATDDFTTEPNSEVDDTILNIETNSDGYNGFIERVTRRPGQKRRPGQELDEDAETRDEVKYKTYYK